MYFEVVRGPARTTPRQEASILPEGAFFFAWMQRLSALKRASREHKQVFAYYREFLGTWVRALLPLCARLLLKLLDDSRSVGLEKKQGHGQPF